jgi:hypothetical protein
MVLDEGVDRCTTMLGASVGISGFFCERKESRRKLDGGGDLSRGDTGQDGVVSPDGTLLLCVRGSLEDGSEGLEGWSWGVAAAERARCIAAADGTLVLCPVMLGGL